MAHPDTIGTPPEKATDLFPDTQPFDVQVMGDGHKHRIGEYYGIAHVLDVLEAVPEAKRTPGFSYALALVERELAEARGAMMADNLRTVAAAGHDINRIKNIALQGHVLKCTPMYPGEEA